MKKTLHPLLWIMLTFLATNLSFAQTSPVFTDPAFHDFLKTKYPGCVVDGVIDPNCTAIKNEDTLSAADYYDITGLEYFQNLKTLYIYLIKSISTIPPSVTALSVDFTTITALPSLPPNLERFRLYENNLLTTIPTIPNSVTDLRLFYGKLTSLPNFPNSLTFMEFYDEENLTALPSFPNSVKDIRIWKTPIAVLPELPPGLENLLITETNITCLPILPDYCVYNISDIGPGKIECIPNIPEQSNLKKLSELPICNSLNSTCPILPNISGTVYYDANSNGIKDVGEPGTKNATILILPQGRITTTDANGNYTYAAQTNGSYTISVVSTFPYYNVLPATNSATITIPASSSTPPVHDLNNNFALTPTGAYKDISVQLTPADRFRAGRPTIYQFNYKNLGTQTIASGQINLLYNSALTGSPAVTPNTSSAGSYSWNFTTLAPGEERTIEITFTPPTTATVGIEYLFTASSTLTGDANTANNSTTVSSIITGSYDPNDIAVTPLRDLTNGDINTRTPLYYTIRFQNKGNDYAFDIIVNNEISEYLDSSTIEIVQTSHPALFSMADNKAKWYFKDIMLDYESHNEAKSHGFIKYKILPKTNVQIYSQINNSADIYFDYNSPITTNTVTTNVVPCGVQNVTYPSHICAGNTYSIPFTLTPCAMYYSYNQFSIQLSDATGSFASPVTIGTLNGASAGTINVTIPQTITPGSYQIRIISSAPYTETINITPVIIHSYAKSDFTLPQYVCVTDQVMLDGSASENENAHWIEIYETTCTSCTNVVNGTYYSGSWIYTQAGVTNLSSIYSFSAGKIYRVKLAVSNGNCLWSEKVKYVTITPTAVPSFTLSSTGCLNQPITFNGSASTNETAYFIEVFKTSCSTCTDVVGPYYSNWFNGQAGSLDLRTLYTFGTGIYKVKLALTNNGCLWSQTEKYITIAGNCKQGIYDEEISSEVTIYSNPAKDYFNVDVPSFNSNVIIQVSNMNGELIKEIVSDSFTTTINIENLTAGIYIVSIIRDEDVVRKKLEIIK